MFFPNTTTANLPNGAVILIYHHFGEAQYPATNVSLAQFDAHLDHLEANQFQVWPLEKIVRQLKAKKPLPARVVAITIDDAYRSIYTHAYPRLKQRGWPFTVFVSTDPVDKKMPAFMSWEEMREMQPHGATFANHSTYHDFLITLQANETLKAWQQRTRNDLLQAQQRLIDELGSAPALFAYPYGEYNHALQQIIAKLGWSAFGQQSGVASRYSNLLAIPRYPMAGPFAAMEQFNTKVMSLPLPVTHIMPSDPTSTLQNPPRLQLILEHNPDIQLDQFNCFASQQGATKITWVDKTKGHVMVEANKAFSQRRSRYNCTAPSKSTDRFYWYSHLWIYPLSPDNTAQ